MRKGALAGLLLIVGGALLGATVLHEPIATAASPFTNVIIGNTSENPVPVAVQNADGGTVRVHEQGTAAVHEQGTADVNVTNGSIPVTGTVNVGNGAQRVIHVASNVTLPKNFALNTGFQDTSDCRALAAFVKPGELNLDNADVFILDLGHRCVDRRSTGQHRRDPDGERLVLLVDRRRAVLRAEDRARDRERRPGQPAYADRRLADLSALERPFRTEGGPKAAPVEQLDGRRPLVDRHPDARVGCVEPAARLADVVAVVLVVRRRAHRLADLELERPRGPPGSRSPASPSSCRAARWTASTRSRRERVAVKLTVFPSRWPVIVSVPRKPLIVPLTEPTPENEPSHGFSLTL